MPKQSQRTPSWAEQRFLSSAQSAKQGGQVAWPLARPLAQVADELAAGASIPEEDGGRFGIELRWAVAQYAEHGALPDLSTWPAGYGEAARGALESFRFYWTDQLITDEDGGEFNAAKLAWGYFGPRSGPDRSMGDAYWWLALAVVAAHNIPIRRCANPECDQFFADAGGRSKRVCSTQCGNRLRFSELKADPRRYAQYLKSQQTLMRERRATGKA